MRKIYCRIQFRIVYGVHSYRSVIEVITKEPLLNACSIVPDMCNMFLMSLHRCSLRFNDLILEISSTVFLGSYRYCLMLLSRVKSLSVSSEERLCLLNSAFNCLYRLMVCISTFVLSKIARACWISSLSHCFSSSLCLIWFLKSSSGIDSDFDNSVT